MSSLAQQLTDSLFCGFLRKEQRMAVFLAFSDESSTGAKHGEFFVGGYVATENLWGTVAQDWQEKVLDVAPTIPYLHMREIRSPKWQADNNITSEQAEERIETACSLLERLTDIAAIVSKISLKDHDDIFVRQYSKRRHVPLGIREPDYFCFVAYAAFVADQVYRKWPEAKKIDFVVSRKSGVTNHIEEFHKDIQAHLRFTDPDLAPLIGDLIPATMEDRVPLQCADVFLWHVQRQHNEGLDKVRPEDERRYAKLLRNGSLDGDLHEWSRSDLEMMAGTWQSAGMLK